jgi:hypothetical protein
MITVALTTMIVLSVNVIIKKKAEFQVSGDVDKIVVGHSHSECAFNDSLINNFANYSRSGESFFYTYYKILPLLEKNDQIDTVFIEFTNNHVEEQADKRIWDEKFMSAKYPSYAPFIDVDGHYLLQEKNPSGLVKAMGLSVLKGISSIISLEFDYAKKIGHYQRLERDKIEVILAQEGNGRVLSAEDSQEEDGLVYTPSDTLPEVDLRYLEKLLAFCKERNIAVYFVRSPLHPKYGMRANEELFQSVLQSRFPEVEFLDFKDFPVANSEFGDLNHLNYRGAEKFSKFFDEMLKKGLLEHHDKDTFIKHEIEENS